MRCDDVREELALYVLGELPDDARVRVADHVASCRRCAEELRHAEALVGLLGGALAEVPAAAGLQERLRRDVAATPLPRRVRPRHVPPIPQPEDEAEHHLRRRTTAQLVAAAAILLAVFVIWNLSPSVAYVQTTKLACEVTVYNDDLALVRDIRTMRTLREGLNEVRFEDVPGRIDPTSVTFTSLTDPVGTQVLDQNYEYDLVSSDKLLARYVDKDVAVISKSEHVHLGRLVGFDADQVILRGTGDQVQMVPRAEVRSIRFEGLPEGLLTRPTLVWQVQAGQAGLHKTVVSYLTGGMSWRCDYVLVKRPENQADFKSWVTIFNQSGATYSEAALKLMAGDVNLVKEVRGYDVLDLDLAVNMNRPEESQGFEEKAFFEYHLYTLGRRTTLNDNSTKQIELTSAAGVGTSTRYVFEGGSKVAVYLIFKNEEANGLGIPLPKGIVRVLQEDTDGSLEFIGEDQIDHTPKDEEVKVLIGSAFDLVGERTVLDDRRAGRSRRATVQVKLRNHKDQPVTIRVRETLEHDWRIAETTHPWKKADARTAEFDIPVLAGREEVLRFSYVATW